MPGITHLLIDAEEGFVADGATWEGGGTGKPKWRVRVVTLRGGRSEGVHVVELDNGHMRIDVVPTRGMGIWRVRRGEHTLGWQSPTGGVVNPALVPLMEPSGLGWLDGFNELLCRCGLESNGPPEFDNAGRLVRPLHGRIANMPARRVELIVDEAEGRIELRGVIDESRFHFQSLRLTATISTLIGSNEFTWADEVVNIGGRDATMQMLYHFNIGRPLLRPGARITAPVGSVAPHSQAAVRDGVESWSIVPPPRPGSDEQVYLLDLFGDDAGDTRVVVGGLAGDEAVGLRFNKRALPCFTIWRNTPAEADGYVVGVEPGTNFPNPHSFEKQHGRVVTLKPGETWSGEVSVAWHTTSGTVAAEEQAIRAIQRERPTNIATSPRADWSAGS